MRVKKINQRDPVVYAVVFEKGDEVKSGLEAFAEREKLLSAHFEGIGALSGVTVRYFDRATKEYQPIRIDEQVEVLVLNGNIAHSDGGYKVHAHVVVGRADGSAAGGDLGEGRVWPTLEVVVTETPAYLRRKEDPETGLALIDLGGSAGG